MAYDFDFNNAPRQQLQLIDTASWDERLEVLRERLQASALELVRTIFPAARIQSNEARIGSVAGEPGESLSIALTGDGAGRWIDHANPDQRGDLIDLWRLTRGSVDFPEAVRELEAWLGIGSKVPKWATRVQQVGEARRIEAEKLPKPDVSLGAPVASYRYNGADGSLLAIIRRYHLTTLDERGKPKKTFRPQTASGEPRMPDPRPLYRLDKIGAASEIILVEGEKCADALEQAGFQATTQMGGAGADPAKTDWTPLAGKRVRVWEDNDAAGTGLARRVRPFLEANGCVVDQIVIPPGKPLKWDAADAVEAGDNIRGILDPPKPSLERPRFEFIDVDDLEHIEPVSWLIDGALPETGLIALYGASGGLKSFIAVDIALHVATGREWQGRAVKRGQVIYIAGEGKRGLGKRVVGWRKAKKDAPRPDFKLLPSSVEISTGEEVDALIEAIRAKKFHPVLIVLDTLARNFGPGDENKTQDMNAFVRGVDRMVDQLGSAVMVVHHTGKDDTKGERGSVALRGALDTSIFVKRHGRRVELVNKAPFGKQKDAEEFETIRLYAAPIEFEAGGVHERTLVLMKDGDVVADDQDDDDDEDDETKPAQRLGPNQRLVMTALEQAARDGQGLGFMRLLSMTKIEKGTLGAVLRKLCEQGRIIEIPGDPKVWKKAK